MVGGYLIFVCVFFFPFFLIFGVFTIDIKYTQLVPYLLNIACGLLVSVDKHFAVKHA